MQQYTNTHNERGVRRHEVGPNATQPGGMTYGESAASGPAPSTAGHHKHDIMNKLDPNIDSTHDKEPLTQRSAPEGTYGPHKSRLANALDPRVDSDGDRARGMDHRTGHPNPFGGAAGGPQHMSGGPAGAPPSMHGAGGYGSSNNRVPEGTYGPHSSRLANAADPRVDSDRDGGFGRTTHHANPAAGYAAGTTAGGGYTGTTPSSRHAGVGGVMGGANTHNVQTGHLPGPAPNTAGPHKSDLLNKLDPAVDSKGTTYQGDVRRGI